MIVCLHTTESDPGTLAGVVNYLNARPDSQPHTAYDPSTGEEHVFLDYNRNAKALAHPVGTPETNNRPGGVFQIEIVGRAADCGGYDDQWYSNLQAYIVQWATILAVAYVFHPDRTRFTWDEWLYPNLRGIVEHCHVPGNTHTDCGTLDHPRLMLSSPLEPQAQEPDVALESTTVLTDGHNVNDHIIWTNEVVNEIKADLASLKNLINSLVQVTQATAAVPQQSGGINYTLAANVTVDEIQRRLAVAAPKS